MKKSLLSLAIVATATVLTTATLIFSSCQKEKPQKATTSTATVPSNEKTICNLNDIYAANYSALGAALFGGGAAGQGTIGAIDTKLNCNQSAGQLCNLVNPQMLNVTAFSSDVANGGWHVLSDGVMTAAEQQTLVNMIQTYCTNHKNATYGTNYVITSYDTHYAQALCGGCPDGLLVLVNYTAGKPCR